MPRMSRGFGVPAPISSYMSCCAGREPPIGSLGGSCGGRLTDRGQHQLASQPGERPGRRCVRRPSRIFWVLYQT